jgi:nucleoside-diphosphate-sugar epimerase
VSPASGWSPTPDKAARVAIDRAVLDAARLGPRIVVLCNTMVYGTGTGTGTGLNPDSVQIPRLARQARANGVVRHIGSGANVWSNVHLGDVCDLYLRALDAAPASSFYFVENGEDSFADIVGAIAGALGLGAPEAWSIEEARVPLRRRQARTPQPNSPPTTQLWTSLAPAPSAQSACARSTSPARSADTPTRTRRGSFLG